jgi:hypothetical protein
MTSWNEASESRDYSINAPSATVWISFRARVDADALHCG